MSVETESKAENPQPTENAPEKSSKDYFRQKVWEHLQRSNLVNFPRPAFGRIPNFKGGDIAAQKLLELTEFQAAKSVEVNPDKALEASRIICLQNDKVLYVPIPRLQQGLLKKIAFEPDQKPDNFQGVVTRYALENKGETIDFENDIHIDLFVLGSVAVSKDGRRIGKGRGYADLEYAILKEMKAIDDSTTIVTTVHESQVFDELPEDIFEKYDVPVDYILTPTEIIKVEQRLKRPEGIFWNLLSQRRVGLMPVLQKVKKAHESEEKDTTLKSEDTDVETERSERRPMRMRRFSRRRVKTDQSNDEAAPSPDNNGGAPSAKRVPLQRNNRRRFSRKRSKVSGESQNKENDGPQPKTAVVGDGKKKLRRYPRRLQVDFSLHVSNIDRNVRVRQLKDALIDRGIKPNNITWRGYRGFCYLHYAKPQVPKSDVASAVTTLEAAAAAADETIATPEVDAEKQFGVDSVIEILQTLKLNSESESNLSVKVMEPITRIETTDVTAV